MPSPTLIELEGVNGEWFTLSGVGKGDRGVWLAPEMSGLFDAPVKTLWNSHAFQRGSTYAGKRELQRDVVFGVHIKNTPDMSWEENHSEFRKALGSFDDEATLWVQTDNSRRSLKFRLSEQPSFTPTRDPNLASYGLLVVTATAGDPDWVEEDFIASWTSTKSTLDGSWETGTIEVSNPTDLPAWPMWIVPDSVIARLPDVSWGSRRFNSATYDAATVDANRRIVLPETLPGYPVRIDTQPDAMMGGYQSKDKSFGKRMNGIRFLYSIPRYTEPTLLPIAIKSAPAGVKLELRLKRAWSGPMGLQ
ncbi:hypothetical protein [Rhodococcoides fascians]|uniref:hypothetical protein n=1 Tax=Rhodococcoides fascians TaxID=1828 RepID=UPI00055B16C2|nr:hypothetical protein [Rhodococcus fascians]